MVLLKGFDENGFVWLVHSLPFLMRTGVCNLCVQPDVTCLNCKI